MPSILWDVGQVFNLPFFRPATILLVPCALGRLKTCPTLTILLVPCALGRLKTCPTLTILRFPSLGLWDVGQVFNQSFFHHAAILLVPCALGRLKTCPTMTAHSLVMASSRLNRDRASAVQAAR